MADGAKATIHIEDRGVTYSFDVTLDPWGSGPRDQASMVRAFQDHAFSQEPIAITVRSVVLGAS